VAVPVVAVNAKLSEPGEYGVCNPFSMLCHDVEPKTIATTGVGFPEELKVISSEPLVDRLPGHN